MCAILSNSLISPGDAEFKIQLENERYIEYLAKFIILWKIPENYRLLLIW